jgi:hypothetical protein
VSTLVAGASPIRKRPTTRSIRQAGAALVAVLTVLATINVTAASAATYALRPDADVTSQWSKVGASTAWDALNDGVAQPTAVGTTDYISSGGTNRVTEVSLADRTLSSETISSGKAWFYAAAGLLSSAKAEVVANGTVRGSTTVSGGLLGSAATWYSISFTPSDQATVNDLRLRFTSTAGSDVTVRAAYFDLVTTPTSSCPLSTPGSPIGMSLSGCKTVASDTAANPDPLPFWGRIDCQTSTRHQQYTSGGDTHATGSGAAQGDSAYRRLTVIDGDNYYGERCELGINDKDGPNVFYREGQRRVTFASIRLPAGTDPSSNLWRTVLQMKQTEPYYNDGPPPAFELEVRSGQWAVEAFWHDLWYAPAQQNVWTRFAFDIVYSSDSAIGSVKTYVDLNGDGDFADAGEQSPLIHAATLMTETAGGPSPYAPGESVPDHLRSGIYQDPDFNCPSGCSVDVDNVQVLGP